MELSIDAEFQSWITPLEPEELAQLEANILADGCREPLVIWSGVIVDGHNRYSICKKHNIPFKVAQKDFTSKSEALNWIIDNQLGRRNLSPFQMSLLRGKRYNAEKSQGKRNDLTLYQNDTKSEFTRDRLAAQYDVSPATIARDGNTAKIAEMVAHEQNVPMMLLTKAQVLEKAKEIQAEKRKQRDEEIKAEREKIASQARNTSGQKWRVFTGDIQTFSHAEQYDFIITDPPYPKEYLSLYEVLARRAKEWLKPGGLLVAMCGQSYLDEIYRMMSKELKYYWTAAYFTPGQPTPLRTRQVNTTWKPILIYGMDSNYKGKIFGDVFTSDRNDKDFHKWGQSEGGMLSLIKQIVLPGQSIFDPFCGAGTTGIAALRHGCLFTGLELDEQNAKISISRLQEVE